MAPETHHGIADVIQRGQGRRSLHRRCPTIRHSGRFQELKADVVPSAILVGCLCKIEGRAWADWNHGKGMTVNNLARQLRKFRICSQSIRVGGKTPKGYRRGDFEDAWSRYCQFPTI